MLAASFLLLMVVFHSVTVALKSTVGNLLSIRRGLRRRRRGGPVGLARRADRPAGHLPHRLAAAGHLLRRAVRTVDGLRGFLLSRIREAYAATGDYVESVARGLAASGHVITCGALIMMAVFLSFVVNPNPFVKMIGIGLAVAIALDATVVRMILVPATMALLGRANWWLPGWLDR
ncbi:MMPL family transporter [Micromonospora sp. NPDC002717]|uniref:MMPL family transporter n=1 Tax=Micromonospora sp. NPDC002717 TaxID=3154424 RepID=UPI00331C85EF